MPKCYVKIGPLKKSIALDVETSDTIASVQARIRSKEEGISKHELRIRHRGEILADSSTLDEIFADSSTRNVCCVECDFCCPWCGRVGNGAYAPGPIGYPICTGGYYSCVRLSWNDRGLDLRNFRRVQLRTIFVLLPSDQDRDVGRVIRGTWRGNNSVADRLALVIDLVAEYL